MATHRFVTASRLALILAALPILPGLLALPGSPLRAQAPAAEEESELGESPERHAQVKVLEGSATIHKGDGQEELTRGTPVTEGDVVESRGRGVLQLADGTRIAFGPFTRFRVAGLFQDRSDGQEVLIRLDQGRLRVRLGSQSEATLRVDTPCGTGLTRGGEITYDMDREEVLRVRVHTGRVEVNNERGRQGVRAGERLTVYGPKDSLDRLNDFNTYDEDAFDLWAAPLLMGHRSESASRVPREIRSFVDDLDGHGRWVYVDECQTQCWVPTGVAEDWRPYYDGRWAPYAGGMTWVSPEPWGYVTYHHGRWGWRAGLGWYWIPGVYYSPAWVAWQTDAAYFGWAPLGFTNRPCGWGYGAWGGGPCWNVVNITYINAPRVHVHIYNDVRVIGSFNRGLGQVPAGPRGPWFRSRMMVTPAEFRNPVQIRQVVSQPALIRARMAEYERGGQRIILRREAPPSSNPALQPHGPGAYGFEHDLPRRPGRPILREATPAPAPAPAPGPRPGGPSAEARPQPLVLPRMAPKDRPRWEESQERPGLPRNRPETRPEAPAAPAREERRVEPPRERPREERRPDPPMERPRLERPAPARQEPRPLVLPRQEPRQEPRPSAPARSERQDHPARENKERRD